jgi:hypothetical protein
MKGDANMNATATEVKKVLRAAFPNHAVSVREVSFTYLHHTATEFGQRTLPAVNVSKLQAKDFTVSTRTGKRLFNNPELDDILTALRNAGLCAEKDVTNGGTCVSVIVAEPKDWPADIVTGMGRWH